MKKVLIVDDVADIADILKIVLQKEYEVQLCTTAEQIYPAVETFMPDLMLLDNQMGQYTAQQILIKLRQQVPGFIAPVVIFTGSMDAANIAESVGAAGYIEKPSDINYIREYIRKILG